MSFTTGNDINILQGTNSQVVGAGAGNDRYVLDASTLNPNQRITLSDTQGVNTLQLAGDLVIVSSLVANDSLQLTLNNGAVITVLGASNFSFQTGGNGVNGTGGITQNYATFVTSSLGLTGVPAIGAVPAAGGTKTVAETGGTSGSGFSLTRPNISLNLINEDQYDKAFAQGLRGDEMLPLAGVFFSRFEFSLNGQQVDLTKEIMSQEGTYSQAVAAINAALNLYKAQSPNNFALQTVRAELGNKFVAGTREGTSILLTADPVIGAAGNSRTGTNMFEADGVGLQLGSMTASLKLYAHVSCTNAKLISATP